MSKSTSKIDPNGELGVVIAHPVFQAVFARPVVAADKALLSASLKRASAETIYRRFFKPIERLSDQRLSYLTDVDHINHIAWGILIPPSANAAADKQGWDPAAVGRFIRLPENPKSAEFAIAILDDYQHQGIGYLLMQILVAVAAHKGLTTLVGHIQPDNEPMIKLLTKFNSQNQRDEDSLICAKIDIADISDQLQNIPAELSVWHAIDRYFSESG